MKYRVWCVGCLLLALALAAGCGQETPSKSTFKVDVTLRVPKKADGNDPP